MREQSNLKVNTNAPKSNYTSQNTYSIINILHLFLRKLLAKSKFRPVLFTFEIIPGRIIYTWKILWKHIPILPPLTLNIMDSLLNIGLISHCSSVMIWIIIINFWHIYSKIIHWNLYETLCNHIVILENIHILHGILINNKNNINVNDYVRIVLIYIHVNQNILPNVGARQTRLNPILSPITHAILFLNARAGCFRLQNYLKIKKYLTWSAFHSSPS